MSQAVKPVQANQFFKAFEEGGVLFDKKCSNFWRTTAKKISNTFFSVKEFYNAYHRPIFIVVGSIVVASLPWNSTKVLDITSSLIINTFARGIIGGGIGYWLDNKIEAKNLADRHISESNVSIPATSISPAAMSRAQSWQTELRFAQNAITQIGKDIQAHKEHREKLFSLDQEIKDILEGGALGKFGAITRLTSQRLNLFAKVSMLVITVPLCCS